MPTTLETREKRIYLVGLPFHSKDAAKQTLGAKWDGDAKQWWVGVAKRAAAEKFVAELNTGTVEHPDMTVKSGDTMSEPDSARVYAKVKYRGANWFVIAESHQQNRCRICRLSGVGIWVDMGECELVKTYTPREYRGRTEYTTLGSIRWFIDSQKRAEARGEEPCADCGKRGHLIEDLEDGLMKCRHCCDMPSE